MPPQIREKMQRKTGNWGRWIFAVFAVIGLAMAFMNMLVDNMPKGSAQKVSGYQAWDKETVELVESLPLQDGGRIKPFSTFAGFQMLQMHGARSMRIEGEGGEIFKIKPSEWLMDTLFRPDFAKHMPTFRVDNSHVLEAIGVEPKGRRDRYSFDEIKKGEKKLFELAITYNAIEKKKRQPLEQQVLDLAQSFRTYESLFHYFRFAQTKIQLKSEDKVTETDLSAILSFFPVIIQQINEAKQKGNQEAMVERFTPLFLEIEQRANSSKYGLFLFPPKDSKETQWLSAGNAIMQVATREAEDPETKLKDIKRLETAVRAVKDSQEDFRSEFAALKQELEARADARGEFKNIGMEVSYFKNDYFLKALVWFLIGSISAMLMWAFGSGFVGKFLSWFTLGSTLIGVSFCIIAIVIRCLIMGRPPVANLYDTVIFIGATGVVLALLIEWMNRQRFALGIAPILGLGLIILARRYEVGDAGDHLDPLIAVLNSNFWLATHVITITLGYSAGLLAALLSCAYVLMRGLNLDANNKDLRRSLSKSVYGCICLTVFLSLVGTVLGGIWANYSWGRFWGWDPKENGALMIVLWTLAILHARLGGLIKEWGLHLSSIFTACIVAFSWWHVNFLGVGLHNYGFTAGKDTIWTFYAVMLGFMIFGIGVMIFESYVKKAKSLPVTQPNVETV